MKNISLVHAPLLSFYSMDLYRDVVRNWKNVAFGYLLALLAVCWVPQSLLMHTKFSQFAEEEGAAIADQIPLILIEGGMVSIDAEQPYYIINRENGELFAILDTTGEVTDLRDSDAQLLLTQRRLFVRKGARETQVYELADVRQFELDSELAASWLEIASDWLAIILYPMFVVGSYLFRMLQAVVFALLGIVLARFFGAQLTFVSLMALAAVALTPAIIVSTLLIVAEINVPFQHLIPLALSLIYLGFAIIANAEPEESPPPIS
ncbi:MAG: DUF1189 family protein [Acidobacteriota bacterium]